MLKSHPLQLPEELPHDTPLLCLLLRKLLSPLEGAKELQGGHTDQGLLWTWGGVQRVVSKGVLCSHPHCHVQPKRKLEVDSVALHDKRLRDVFFELYIKTNAKNQHIPLASPLAMPEVSLHLPESRHCISLCCQLHRIMCCLT